MLELDSLDGQTFEALALLLLRRESYELTSSPALSGRGGDSGVDAIAIAPDGQQTFVIVKHLRGKFRTSSLQARRTISVAVRLREQFPESNILQITSIGLTREAFDLLHENRINAWDRTTIDHLLSVHLDIADAVQKKAEERDLNDLFREPEEPSRTTLESRVTAELAGIPPGKTGWKTYEVATAKLLTEIFLQHLDPPKIQNRTDDGLDIMDAIFDIPHTDSSWSQARSTYKTHFVIAEFKNYTGNIEPKAVRQLVEYLWPKAFRMFGVVVSRKGPNDQAIAARRRAWLDHEKIIVFLDDNDLIELARLVDNGDNPYNLIHLQLMDFFRTLNP
ncbi:restriction endonuclease [Nocardia noduli]|uniref:restriction endonuclease n=1 Tax=Nocardia noduli TaxID=2815722 RepID=UPI001C223389|nr:restriction endonuclease [Nocardia noduli]